MKNIITVFLVSILLFACQKDEIYTTPESVKQMSSIRETFINTDAIFEEYEESGFSLRTGFDTFALLTVGVLDDLGMGGDRDNIAFNHFKVAYYVPDSLIGNLASQTGTQYLASLKVVYKDSTSRVYPSVYVDKVHKDDTKYIPWFLGNSYFNHPAKYIHYKMLNTGEVRFNELRNQRYLHRNFEIRFNDTLKTTLVKNPLKSTETQFKPIQVI